jgi:hypothetical protein
MVVIEGVKMAKGNANYPEIFDIKNFLDVMSKEGKTVENSKIQIEDISNFLKGYDVNIIRRIAKKKKIKTHTVNKHKPYLWDMEGLTLFAEWFNNKKNKPTEKQIKSKIPPFTTIDNVVDEICKYHSNGVEVHIDNLKRKIRRYCDKNGVLSDKHLGTYYFNVSKVRKEIIRLWNMGEFEYHTRNEYAMEFLKKENEKIRERKKIKAIREAEKNKNI